MHNFKIHDASTNTLFRVPCPTQCSHSPRSANPGWLTATLFSQIPHLSLHAPLPLASTLPTPAAEHGKCFLCLRIKSPRRIWISHFSCACCFWLEPFCLLDWKQLKTPPRAACSPDQDPGELWRPAIPDTELPATYCFPTALHHSINQSPGRSAGDLANAKWCCYEAVKRAQEEWQFLKWTIKLLLVSKTKAGLAIYTLDPD